MMIVCLVLLGLTASADWLEPQPARFVPRQAREQPSRSLDIVAADLDVDGDPDLLINWHHLAPVELFENRNGQFTAWENLRSGIADNAAFPRLFATAGVMDRKIRSAAPVGLILWHDEARTGHWRFRWRDPDQSLGGLHLTLNSLVGLHPPESLQDDQIVSSDETQLVLQLAESTAFAVKTKLIGVRLEVMAENSMGDPVPVWVGPEFTAAESRPLHLWKDDPHGIAVANVDATPRPEVFITRGAVQGKLEPPGPQKVDRFFRPVSESLDLSLVPGLVPPDYSRGRGVQWVDLDNDGTLELSISARESSNRLLVFGPDHSLSDRANELGLADLDSDVLAWGDFDGDGWEDLFALTPTQVDIYRNEGGVSFTRLSPDQTGLTLPTDTDRPQMFDHATLRLADFDRDGQLDLWALGIGRSSRCHLWVRRGSGFTEWTGRVGLDQRTPIRKSVFVLGDFDNDGDDDVVELGGAVGTWENIDGRSFTFSRVKGWVANDIIGAAALVDVDGDGRLDVVAAGKFHHLLLNQSAPARPSVSVRPTGPVDPVGTVVTATYRDGERVARRLGSMHATLYSQSMLPLHFGYRTQNPIEAISVRWPGETSEASVPVPSGHEVRTIRR